MDKHRVLRPIPDSQSTDSRQYQLNQLRRRFAVREADEAEEAEATTLTLSMTPTDPDFPFEMTALHCVLKVPHDYPGRGRPSLRVINSEMDRGYQINVERGFDTLATTMPGKTLLALLHELDKDLENLLVSEKVQTIKLVTHPGRKLPATAADGMASSPAHGALDTPTLPDPVPQHIAQQLAVARQKRESDVRQLEARMGRQPLFAKSSNSLSFSVPFRAQAKASNLPASLQRVETFELFVPRAYNLEPCSITFTDSHSEDANRVEAAFERHARLHTEMTLTAHVNHLVQNMSAMAKEIQVLNLENSAPLSPIGAIESATPASQDKTKEHEFEHRSHIHIIPRPPEWSQPGVGVDETDSSDADDTDDESEDELGNEDGAPLPFEPPPPSDAGDPGHGVRLSFPSLELYGAELLQLSSLSLTIKCNRCKEVSDIKNIKPRKAGDLSLVKRERCKKCADEMRIGYRSELMHSNSVRAGYVDGDGCGVVDLLPRYDSKSTRAQKVNSNRSSHFIPTCAQCSTPYPAPGVVSVRGESTMAICRECHQKMTFRIPDVKFLRESVLAGTRTDRPLPPRKRPKENLGVISGQELPRWGRCQHYAKSYRWFRFGCCSKVYPCDRCHDVGEEHPNEHASRMICGFCVREQPFRPEDCIHCRCSLVRKQASGFWEGGKGTRDRVRMSRKDPRKHKRQ